MDSITKKCSDCKEVKDASCFANQSKEKDRLRSICKVCANTRERIRYKNWTEDKKNKQRDYHRELRNRTRKKIISEYGGKCTCCGESRFEFLAIDHVNNDGHLMRGKVHPNGAGFYYWLVKNNYPPDFQILCHNCNSAKGSYGYCPHKMENQNASSTNL